MGLDGQPIQFLTLEFTFKTPSVQVLHARPYPPSPFVKFPGRLLLLSILFVHFSHLCFSAVAMSLPGGIFDVPAQNSAECEELARFGVQEHNKKANTRLEFSRVVKAKEQVVAGTMYYITLEVVEAGQKKIYEAKVWVKPWENFKELQEFKPVGDSSSTPSHA